MNQNTLIEPPRPEVRNGRTPTGLSSRAHPVQPELFVNRPPLVKSLVGTVITRVCPTKRPCAFTNCWAQPFCKCARADWAYNKKVEGRVWLAVGGCGLLVLVIAFARAMIGL
jgi:hypothetical protein